MKRIDIQGTREDLAMLFVGAGAEIGVERGHYSKTILTKGEVEALYLVDPWKAYSGYREHVTQSKLDGFYDETLERLAGGPVFPIREYSTQAAESFDDDTLDFVYIDANHSYDNVKADMDAWWPKVASGGIFSGHDYIKRKGQDHMYGVVPAVNEWCEEHNIPLLFIWRGDKSPSWMIIKP